MLRLPAVGGDFDANRLPVHDDRSCWKAGIRLVQCGGGRSGGCESGRRLAWRLGLMGLMAQGVGVSGTVSGVEGLGAGVGVDGACGFACASV